MIGALLMTLLIFGGTAFRVWQVARADDRRPVDVVIVLGAAQYNGEPSPVLKARLQQALRLYQDGLMQHVITVGGRQAGDQYTEAQAGRMWLAKNGIPASHVVDVDTGSDTFNSMQAVAKLADQRGWHTALIVTDPWHSFRARTMANDVGLETWSSPTHSGPIVQTRAIQEQYIFWETIKTVYYRLTHSAADTSVGALD